jgi:pyruvate formate lyase activating enzyme
MRLLKEPSFMASKTGFVTNIQRFSTDDGPGIRTTVFFKGCTLSCQWCHNPETIFAGKQLQYEQQSCRNCGACTQVCPAGVHSVETGSHRLDWSRCTRCFACVDRCFYGALSVIGREISAKDLGEQLLRDRAFYDKSGGGVTFSGGEPLLQADFCAEVFRFLKSQGIHTAVDTAGNVSFSQFETILPWTDLFLFDIKVVDPQKHKEQTGAENGLVLENFKRLLGTGADIWVRTPLVKGINDGDAETAGKIAIINNNNTVKKVELLPYHSYGLAKYKALGMTDTCAHFQKPEGETLIRIFKQMEAAGICGISIQ